MSPISSRGDQSPEKAPAECPLPALFDGHNDTLLRLHMAAGEVEPFFVGRQGHIDLPKARAGGFGGGLFAVFVPSPSDEDLLAITDDDVSQDATDAADATGAEDSKGAASRTRTPVPKKRSNKLWARDNAPYSPPVATEVSIEVASAVVDLLERLIEASEGQALWMKNQADLEAASRDFDEDLFVVGCGGDAGAAPLRIVLHFEGAEPIEEDLKNLEHWYERGLRSLGLVWSRRNDFAAGVPFRYPSGPDHFEGLSAPGFDLVRACDDLGILVDLAHLNEKGFWDVQRTSRKPLVASHTGALSICASSRNLTDDQIRAVGDSDGVVGINLHCGDLRPDGRLNSDTPLSVVIQHIETMVELIGSRHVALGSDFDGALMPRCLEDASQLPVLLGGLRDRGWSEENLRAFAYGNWLRALGTAWVS